MGFGYVFLGYLISTNFVYSSYTALLSVLVMLMGMRTLGGFNRPLREAKVALYPGVPLGAVMLIGEILNLFGLLDKTVFSPLNTTLHLLLYLLMLYFTDRLLCGIRLLCEETDLPKMRFRAVRNRFLSLCAFSLSAVLNLPVSADWYRAVWGVASLPVLLFLFVVMILNAVLLYSCYMRICMPEDLGMERKETGIGFVDEINRKLNEKEERNIAREKEELAKLYHERETKYHEKIAKENKRKKK